PAAPPPEAAPVNQATPPAGATVGTPFKDEFTPPAQDTTHVAPPPPPPPPVEAQAQQDAASVADVYRSSNAGEAAKKLESLVASRPGDKAYADALLKASDATLQKIGGDLGYIADKEKKDDKSKATVRDSLSALGRVADAAGPDGVKVISQRLAEGLPNEKDLGQFDDTLKSLTNDCQCRVLTDGLVQALAPIKPKAVEGLSELTQQAKDGVSQARGDYDKALEKKTQAEARLNEDLARFGAALAPEQLEAYKNEYRAKHKDVYDAETQAADKLASTLESSRGSLETLAVAGDEKAIKELYDGYQSLAKSGQHADDAIRWVGNISQLPLDQNPVMRTLQSAKGKDFETKLQDDILTPALPNAQAEILGKDRPAAPGTKDDDPAAIEADSKAASEELTSLLVPLRDAKALAAIPGAVKDFQTALGTAVNHRNYDTLANNFLTNWKDQNGFMKALGIAGVVQSGFGAVSAFQDGKYPDAIIKSAAFANSGLEVTAGVLNTMSSARPFAHNAAKFAARMAPGVGLALNGLQMSKDVEKLKDNKGDPGAWMQVMGTGISLAGNALQFVPVLGTAAGAVISGVGAGIHLLGGMVSGLFSGDDSKKELKEERTALVQKAAQIDESAAKNIVEAGSEDHERLINAGLTPKDIQNLAGSTDPKVDLNSTATAAYAKAAQAFGLKDPQALTQLIKQAQGNPQDPLTMIVTNTMNDTSLEFPRMSDGKDWYNQQDWKDLGQKFRDDLLKKLDGTKVKGGKELADLLRKGDPSQADVRVMFSNFSVV
ncbi:hypothetical protein, partial [Myxococcus sp. CA039A]|uniref:hypothetical protein n=1 Tax=Myxococcus sp. CA039A TaxID=2741737 RepID=UPI001C2DCE83